MTTCLCDVHVSYIRSRGCENLCKWTDNPQNVYIGRRGIIILNSRRFPEKDSIWHNPFKVGKDGDLQTVLNMYYEYITKRLTTEENLYRELGNLKGKCLGCWCVGNDVISITNTPLICHGQILMYLVNYYYPSTTLRIENTI